MKDANFGMAPRGAFANPMTTLNGILEIESRQHFDFQTRRTAPRQPRRLGDSRENTLAGRALSIRAFLPPKSGATCRPAGRGSRSESAMWPKTAVRSPSAGVYQHPYR